VIDADEAKRIAERFDLGTGAIDSVAAFGSGLINDTFLVKTAGAGFILQKINQAVFKHPRRLMENHHRIISHANRGGGGDFRLPELILSKNGDDCVQDNSGGIWRMQVFVSHTQTFDTVVNEQQAEQAGVALASFQWLLSDLDSSKLHDILPGFHVTPAYLRDYDDAQSRQSHTGADSDYCRAFIEDRRALAGVLDAVKDQLPIRVIHGDPKLNNILFDGAERAVAMVDLDTVSAGLIHYDLGDCLRSLCNRAGESPQHNQTVQFDVAIAAAMLRGYMPIARRFITAVEQALFYPAIRLLPFELGLRFFTDYLLGNRYFKVRDPGHNLRRAVTQFRLTEDIENKESAITSLLAGEGCR